MSCKRDSSLTNELILMKLYTAADYKLSMCMKEDNPGTKYFMGDI